jgi:hypothetical protein
MAVVVIDVPSRAYMANGIGKAILYGIEYEVISDSQVELTCADEMKLAKLIVMFKGKIVSAHNQKPVIPSLPRHEA